MFLQRLLMSAVGIVAIVAMPLVAAVLGPLVPGPFERVE